LAKSSAAGLLTSVDSMFTTQEERDNAQRSYVTDLPIAEISDFPDHPFKVRMDESMTEMVESVKERGVLSPVLVRPMPDGGYQMVSGHRRKFASELAELPTVPCIVRELTDDEAIIIMVDSNLQRERVLPSEKAFAYKMKLDAMKRQGERTDLTCAPTGHKLENPTSAITNSLSQNLFVLEVQVPDYLTNIILPDQSTGLWDGFDVCVPTTALNRLPFNVYAAMDCYSPRLAILSLSVLAHNEYLPIMRLTRLEQDVIAEMNESAIEPFLTTVNDFFSQFRPTQLYHGIHVGQIPNMDDPAKRIRSLERQGDMGR